VKDLPDYSEYPITTIAALLTNSVTPLPPKDTLAARQQDIHSGRDRKSEAARKQRQLRRLQAA
jgi:hypothetical protein